MGLKISNYEINGIILPEAYAIYETIDTTSQPVVASFKVHSSRENALKKQPLERKYVQFYWDRKSDLVISAYDAAKTKKINIYDPETHEIKETYTKKGIFDGWEDDIEFKE